MIKTWLTRWFFLMMVLSTMVMPMVVNLNAVPTLVLPMLVALWLLMMIQDDGLNIPKLAVMLLGLMLVGQLLALALGDVHMLLPMLLGCVWFVLAFALLSLGDKIKAHTDIIFSSYLLVAFVWVGVAAYVWLGFSDGEALQFAGMAMTQDQQTRPTGPFANANVFAILMVCAWLMAAYAWLTKQQHGLAYYVVSVFFLIWVFASLSRGAWLASAMVVVFLLVSLVRAQRWKALLLLVMGTAFAWLVADGLLSVVSAELDVSGRAGAMAQGGARLVLYPSIVEIWRDFPLFGVGFGNIIGSYLSGQAQALAYLPDQLETLGATSSGHNHFLHMLAETGVMGLMVWLLLSMTLLAMVWRKCLILFDGSWLPLMLALVLWLQGLVNISMNEPLPFFLFFLFLSLALAQGKQLRQHHMLRIPKAAVVLVLGLFIVVLAYQSVVVSKSWALYAQTIFTTTGKARGPLVKQALEYDNIYPRVMIQVAMDFAVRDVGEQSWVAIIPNLERAVYLEQWPTLYQALFYAYAKQQAWDKACQLGQFIKQQRWPGDKNADAYAATCRGEPGHQFKLAWQEDAAPTLQQQP